MTRQEILNSVTMTAHKATRNPNMPSFKGDHWLCTFSRPGEEPFAVHYSQGYGWNSAEPKKADVMQCLACEIPYADESFEFFCEAADADPDSRRALAQYEAMKTTALLLRGMFTDEEIELLREDD